ncbi:DUF3800 domain-containing protein [Bacillus mycoides]|uniref:DUF3800 domain-containing protein n=1 Tax=Bacillus mycoides TaxID=1405 RepID=UPI0036E95A26
MSDWRNRPTLIENWNKDIDTFMAIDENGTTDFKGIQKKVKEDFFSTFGDQSDIVLPHDRWFTITGVVMERNNFVSFKNTMNSIKYGYWNEGKYQYKKGLQRVVLHSREIRKKEGPFNPKVVNYGELMGDISSLVEKTNFKIFSSSIDKLMHILSYSNPFPVYNLCLEFIVERYCRYLRGSGKTGMLLLESRGKKEDKIILEHLVDLLENGNRYWGAEDFQCIKGVYFNPKWCFKQENQKSFILLELTDLVSYPIFKYVSVDKKDRAFEVIEQKIHNYPQYSGYGLKKFP